MERELADIPDEIVGIVLENFLPRGSTSWVQNDY